MQTVTNKRLGTILMWMLLCFSLGAQQLVRLYPDDSCARTRRVTLECYPSTGSHTAVVVCPGGSYCWLDYENEGVEVAKFLQAQGISAFVLRYRVATWWAWALHYRYIVRGNRQPDMWNDGQQALAWVSTHAAQYDISPDSIGIMGFSAGGHMAMSQAVYPGPVRPAFVAPIYPVVTMQEPYVHRRSRRGLLGERGQHSKQLRQQWSLEQHITNDCPPVFMINCMDDPIVDYHNAVVLADSLLAHNVSYYHKLYAAGGHGFGVSEEKGSPESRGWKWEFLAWLRGTVQSDCRKATMQIN